MTNYNSLINNSIDLNHENKIIWVVSLRGDNMFYIYFKKMRATLFVPVLAVITKFMLLCTYVLIPQDLQYLTKY